LPISTRWQRQRRIPLWFAIIFALLALGTLLLLGKVFLDDARVRAFESEDENKRNQEAILRLLNEMGYLRGRRPDRAGIGHRGRDRRDRRLDQFHDRGAAQRSSKASIRRPSR
jgi:hypothetical protein